MKYQPELNINWTGDYMRRLGILIGGLLAVVLAGCGGTGGAGSTLAVGAFNPFSGRDASFGPEMMGGCIPAVNLVNQAGGVLGHKISCQAVDTRGDPADAVPAATKMIATTTNLVGVLGPSADEADATVPVLNSAKIPMFADTGEAAFDRSKYTYFYRLTPADDVKGYALAEWAHQSGYTRAAAVFGNDTGAQSDVPTLLKAFKALGGTITSNQSIALDQSSYRTEVTQMLAGNPQVIFTETDPQTAATYLSEVKQLHGMIPVIATETSLQAPWLKAVRGAIGTADMTKYVIGMEPLAPTTGAAWKVFNSSLLASGKSVPNPAQWSTDPYSMTYYDGVNLMALAMLVAKSTSPSVYQPKIVAVAQASPGAVVVNSFAQGKQALASGKKIQYVGAIGPIIFDQWHNASGAYEAASSLNGTNVKILGTVSAAQIAKLKRGG
jgi:ABC-type branched-subunit amino acid transport system substrate-binding protein